MRKPEASLTTSKFGLIQRAVMMCLIASLSFAVPSAAIAQELRGTSFSTESGDHSVEWNDNWTASLTAEDDFSTMVMLEGQIMIYAVMFIHDEDLGLSERAVYHSLSGVLVNSFDSPPALSIEWEGSDGSYLGAHLLQLSGIDFVLFLRVDPPSPGSGPSMQFAAAPVSAFPVSLQAMQDELVVDGQPVFEGESGEDVIARIDGETVQAEAPPEPMDAEEAPAADAAEADSDRSNPLHDRSRLQRDAHLGSTTSDNSWESPAHGFVVRYTESWEDMALTDATIGEFSIVSDSGRSVISFTGRDTTETNRQAFFEDIVARESRYSGYVGSVIGDDRLLIATWTADNELAVLEYVFVDDSTVVTIMATITSGNPDRYVEDIQEITLEGTPILQDWDELWPDE